MKRMLFVGLLLLSLPCAWAQTNVDFTRTEDVIYGRKFGTALTFDVFQPHPANGVGICLMVSGGWYSSHDAINANFFLALLNHRSRHRPENRKVVVRVSSPRSPRCEAADGPVAIKVLPVFAEAAYAPSTACEAEFKRHPSPPQTANRVC